MTFKMDDKVYDILKWIVMIVLPAVTVFYSSLANVWGWGYAEQITSTLSCIQLFLGSLIGISTASTKKIQSNRKK